MIDLHLHTNNSDGRHSVAEILTKCEEAKLSLISITDHWTMLGYDDLKDPAVRKLFSGQILPGCEFTAHYEGQGIEILGYGIDPEDAREYLSQFPPLEKKWEIELEELIKQYRKMDIRFNETQVRQNLKDGHGARGSMFMEIVRYPENTARFTDPGSAENSGIFSRREVYNKKSPFFLHNGWFSPPANEVCDFIHSIGGKAIIAHPGAYDKAIYEATEELIRFAKPDGLEAWYAVHTPEQREWLLSLCKKYDLLYSGGSDYHHEIRAAKGYRIGLPQIADIYPVDEIMQWIQPLKKI